MRVANSRGLCVIHTFDCTAAPRTGDHASASSQPNPHIKKTSTHPSEATYPCCIPALGELGDVPPRGGKDQCTPCPDRTAPQAARTAAQPAPQAAHEPHRPCHDPWSSQPHDQRHREIKRQNAASPRASRVKEGGRVCLMRNRTRILCVCFKFGRLFL